MLASFLSTFLLLKNTAKELTALFCSVLVNPNYILHDLLPLRKVTRYIVRSRSHDPTLPGVDAFSKRAFIMQMFCDFVYIFDVIYTFCKLLCVCWYQSNDEYSCILYFDASKRITFDGH